MVYAIFSVREGKKPRVMHAAREGESKTVCKLGIGRGSGLVRDGDYHNNRPCLTCWPTVRKS